MIAIQEYAKPQSVTEAYSLLTAGENAAIIGGGVFLRLSSRKIGKAIDLSKAGLGFIREDRDKIELGAMTTFGELERSEVLQRNLDGLLPATVRNIAGVQLRNMVTVGGTVFGRYGFSEFLASLMVLDVYVHLHHHGSLSLQEFMKKGNVKDIVEKVIISNQPIKTSYQMFRNSSGSLPILCVAASKADNKYKIAVGGRPGVAILAQDAMETMNAAGSQDEAVIEKAADMAATSLSFGNDRRASTAYRRELCRVLVKRALTEVQA